MVKDLVLTILYQQEYGSRHQRYTHHQEASFALVLVDEVQMKRENFVALSPFLSTASI